MTSLDQTIWNSAPEIVAVQSTPRAHILAHSIPSLCFCNILRRYASFPDPVTPGRHSHDEPQRVRISGDRTCVFASTLPKSWVMHLWRNERRLFILSGLCKVLWSTCLMCIMFFLHEMGDEATGNLRAKDSSKALQMCFGLIPLMLLYSVSNVGRDYFSTELASRYRLLDDC